MILWWRRPETGLKAELEHANERIGQLMAERAALQERCTRLEAGLSDATAQNRLLRDLVSDGRALQQAHATHYGQLLAVTADHARAEKTIEHLAQLMTLTAGEKATLLEHALRVPAPRPVFEAAPVRHFDVESSSPRSAVMATPTVDPPGDLPGLVGGIPGVPGQALGDALNRLRDEREAAGRRGGQAPQTPGIFDDLGDDPEEIAANEARLTTP